MVDPIRNSKNIINQVESEMESDYNKRSKITESLDEKFNELLEQTIDEDVINNDEDGTNLFVLMKMYREMALKENLLSKSKELFKNAAAAWKEMSSNTEKETKRAMNQESDIDHAGLNAKQKKRLRYITKKLIESFYFNYNVVLNKHHKLKTLYSKKFFDDVINSFKLTPTVNKQVREQFNPAIKKIVEKVHYLGKQKLEEYKEENPKGESPIKNQSQLFILLDDSDKRNVQMQASELVGRIIGFAAAMAVSEYFETNSEAMESVKRFNKDGGQLLETILYNIDENIIRSEEHNKAYQHTVNESSYYEGWESLTNEEVMFLDVDNQTIFDKYINNEDENNE